MRRRETSSRSEPLGDPSQLQYYCNHVLHDSWESAASASRSQQRLQAFESGGGSVSDARCSPFRFAPDPIGITLVSSGTPRTAPPSDVVIAYQFEVRQLRIPCSRLDRQEPPQLCIMSKTSDVSWSLLCYRNSGPLREAKSGQRVDEDGRMSETAARHALTTILRPAECRSPAAMREHVADLGPG